jgi:hypothetical protein
VTTCWPPTLPRKRNNETIPMDATLNALYRAHFSWTDVLRRAQGDAFEALGLGPNECYHRMVASGSHWRLRDYTDHNASPCLHHGPELTLVPPHV